MNHNSPHVFLRVLIEKMNESTMFPTWLAERMDSEEIIGLDFADLQLEVLFKASEKLTPKSSSLENKLQAVKAVETLHRCLILKKRKLAKAEILRRPM